MLYINRLWRYIATCADVPYSNHLRRYIATCADVSKTWMPFPVTNCQYQFTNPKGKIGHVVSSKHMYIQVT